MVFVWVVELDELVEAVFCVRRRALDIEDLVRAGIRVPRPVWSV